MKEIYVPIHFDKNGTYKRADLHMHSERSDGCLPVKDIVRIAHLLNLDEVAITDHDEIGPAQEAQKYSCDNGYDQKLNVIVGEEITTRKGKHVCVLYLKENIPPFQPVEWTIKEAHKQRALVYIPHPMYKGSISLGEEDILSLLNNPDPEMYLDGLEIYNASIPQKYNDKALQFYREHVYTKRLGAPIGNTDGHYRTVGRGLTGFYGDLRSAIKNGQTVVLATDEKEHIEPLDYVTQLFKGLIVQPTKRTFTVLYHSALNLQ